VLRLTCSCFPLFSKTESMSGGSEESIELLVCNAVKRIFIDLQLFRQERGDDLQIDLGLEIGDKSFAQLVT
jgi:hypothetical protein